MSHKSVRYLPQYVVFTEAQYRAKLQDGTLRETATVPDSGNVIVLKEAVPLQKGKQNGVSDTVYNVGISSNDDHSDPVDDMQFIVFQGF